MPDTTVIKVGIELPEELHREVKAEVGKMGGRIKDACREALTAWLAKRRGEALKKAPEPDGLVSAIDTLRLLAKERPENYETAIGIIALMEKGLKRAGPQSQASRRPKAV